VRLVVWYDVEYVFFGFKELNVTDDELKALVASLAVAQQKTDEQFKETDRKLEKVSELLGGIGKNQGDVCRRVFLQQLS
jgi:hypothetical protein